MWDELDMLTLGLLIVGLAGDGAAQVRAWGTHGRLWLSEAGVTQGL